LETKVDNAKGGETKNELRWFLFCIWKKEIGGLSVTKVSRRKGNRASFYWKSPTPVLCKILLVSPENSRILAVPASCLA